MGVAVVICGIGFSRVTALLAVFVESEVSTAPIAMAFEAGGNSGAEYRPTAEMVPFAALPPATPFTDQFTATAAPFICAVKLCVSPPRIVALAGVTVRLLGEGGGLPPPLLTSPEHPVRRSANTPLTAIS